MRSLLFASLPALLLLSCNGAAQSGASADGASTAQAAPTSSGGRPFAIQPLGEFAQPWAMTFLPNGQLLVTEKEGRLRLVDLSGASPRVTTVTGTPQVAYGGQGGLGDVLPHPDFRNNNLIYLSYAEGGSGGTYGAAVARGRLVLDGAQGGRIEGLQVIWRQEPKVEGQGHYGHRLAFSPDGFLFISSGERQKFTPAQDMNANLGKIIRVTDAGGIPSDNPFYGQGGAVRGAIWSYGHRNPLGIAFDSSGNLWEHEMGPQGGDEFNRIERGSNYGYPTVSNGDHYDGRAIPDHNTRPEFNAPEITWNGVSPAGLMIYNGSLFPQWRGNAFLGGLSGETLIRVQMDGTTAREAERWDMDARIREVEAGPDGAIYVLEDGDGGRLLKLTPAR